MRRYRPHSAWRQALRSFRKKFSFWKQERWPKPSRLILTAYQIAEREGYDKAVAWAERHACDEARHGIHMLHANRDKEDARLWLKHVNTYLGRFDVSPLVLTDSPGSLIHRLHSTPRDIFTEGPLISVIMCAYNAEETIEMAARSILRQSWRPLELLIVDDRSTDGTAAIATRLAKEDPRVKVHLNAANVGPYVGRNLALRHAKGTYVTCHDSDDWAHPERLEGQISLLVRKHLAGTISGMLRMRKDGQFVRFTRAGRGSADGILKLASVSAMFERNAFDTHLQYWDSVRFGADTELLHRAEMIFKKKIEPSFTFSMLALAHQNSLTANPVTGIQEKDGMSIIRKNYSENYNIWHRNNSIWPLVIQFPPHKRPFEAPDEAIIPMESILMAISKSRIE